jgi:hypothetical protein
MSVEVLLPEDDSVMGLLGVTRVSSQALPSDWDELRGKVVFRGLSGEESRHTRARIHAAQMFARWHLLAGRVAELIMADEDPDCFPPVTIGARFFCDIASVVKVVFRAAENLARRAQDITLPPFERAAGTRIAKQLNTLCGSPIGDRFGDWLRARTVFLINYRELLRDHPGERVLIARRPGTDEWQIHGISSDVGELVQRAKAMGCTTRDYYIAHVVEGAEEIEMLDLSRPEML